MPRVARIVIPGWPHHVTQRGNNRQDIFFVDDDRRFYLQLLGEQARRFGLSVLAYCLMTNHVHLIVVPPSGDALARAVGRTDFLYTRYVNRLHGRAGHLWQNRFYSAATDEAGLWPAACYVEQNPVRAKLVRRAEDWPWSSAAAHCGQSDTSGLLDLSRWSRSADRWRELLRRRQASEQVEAIRTATHRGRPLGSDSLLSKIEKLLGRRVRPQPVGRPKGARKKAKK
jgi:putative transposase